MSLPGERQTTDGKAHAGPSGLSRIASEYREMPGLRLTAAQASRLWACDLESSQAALDSLVEEGLLYRTTDGSYILRSGSPTRAGS